MLIVLATCGNGYCGCDAEEVFFYNEEDITVSDINEKIYTWARENGESFAYVHFGWGEEYTDEEYEDFLEEEVAWEIYELPDDVDLNKLDEENLGIEGYIGRRCGIGNSGWCPDKSKYGIHSDSC